MPKRFLAFSCKLSSYLYFVLNSAKQIGLLRALPDHFAREISLTTNKQTTEKQNDLTNIPYNYKMRMKMKMQLKLQQL